MQQHPAAAKVYYPGLRIHPNHAVALQQASGFGGIVSFSLKNDTEAAAHAFVGATDLFKLAESLGGIKSLLCHPASLTHKSIPAEKRHAAGVRDGLIRLSVRLEEPADLMADLAQAFTSLEKNKTEISIALQPAEV